MAPEQSGSRPGKFDIPYPSTVSPEDLTTIDRYISQGKTLEVSVALRIHEESSKIRDYLGDYLALPPLTPEEMEDEKIVEKRFREGSNILFFAGTTAFFYSFASSRLLAAAGEEIPRNTLQNEGIGDLVIGRIFRDFATREELTMDEVEQLGATHRAEGIIFEQTAQNEFKNKSPLEFIDFCTKEGEQTLGIFSQDLSTRIWREALMNGGTRFHQLFEAMQQELPQSQ